MIKKVLLYPNPTRDINLECTKKVAAFLKVNNVDAYIPSEISGASSCGAIVADFNSAAKEADIVISFGGDGTILDAASQAAQFGIPILGINIGRVGYMAALEANEIGYLQEVLNGDYEIEERMMLDILIRRNNNIVYNMTALNDAVILKTGVLWTVDMDIYADQMFISNYNGDGVIVATPTGSTAYSLSAGGPIIDPLAKNITITPVCAHALSPKPIVLSRERIINIVPINSQSCAVAVSVDGNEGFELMQGDSITIKASDTVTKLINVKKTNFYDVLYTKLSDRRFS